MASETARRAVEAFLIMWPRLTAAERDDIFLRMLNLDPQVHESRIPDLIQARADAKTIVRRPLVFRRDSVA